MVGVVIYLYREELWPRLHGRGAVGCLAVLTLMLHAPTFAEAALVTLGAYVLFWLAFKADIGALQKINDKWDVSYGA